MSAPTRALSSTTAPATTETIAPRTAVSLAVVHSSAVRASEGMFQQSGNVQYKILTEDIGVNLHIDLEVNENSCNTSHGTASNKGLRVNSGDGDVRDGRNTRARNEVVLDIADVNFSMRTRKCVNVDRCGDSGHEGREYGSGEGKEAERAHDVEVGSKE